MKIQCSLLITLHDKSHLKKILAVVPVKKINSTVNVVQSKLVLFGVVQTVRCSANISKPDENFKLQVTGSQSARNSATDGFFEFFKYGSSGAVQQFLIFC